MINSVMKLRDLHEALDIPYPGDLDTLTHELAEHRKELKRAKADGWNGDIVDQIEQDIVELEQMIKRKTGEHILSILK